MLKYGIIAVAALATAAGSANALFISQTQNVPVTATDITGSLGTKTFNYWQNVAPVNSMLTSVQLEIRVAEQLQALTLQNTDPNNPQTFRYVTYSNISVVGTGPAADRTALKTALNTNGGSNGNIDLFDTGNLAYTPNQVRVFAPPTVTVADDSNLINAASTAAYNTTGTFDLGFTTLTFQSFVGGGGNGSSDQTTTASATITVIYNYILVPAPGSAALLGLGGLVAVRRRRQA